MRIVDALPKMILKEALDAELRVLPEYDTSIPEMDAGSRLLALNNVYSLFVPTTMSREIYAKLYAALYRALERKDSLEAVQQSNHIFRVKMGIPSSAVALGSDSLTLIGRSGIGKSRCISEALRVIAGKNLIEIEDPFRKIIPVVMVQTPFDCSVKSLLLAILQETDRQLNTSYYDYAVRNRATTDVLIMTVSQMSLQHIGMIIVDEIQNCIKAKNGRNLIGCLTQLINNAGIAVVMVGTPECTDFFEAEMHLARRSSGLRFTEMKYGEEFREICKYLFSYQYVCARPVLTEDLCLWMWEKTQGNVSILVGMVIAAQEQAILSGREILDRKSLQEAYDQRLASLHVFLQPKKQYMHKRKRTEERTQENTFSRNLDSSFLEAIHSARKQSMDPVKSLVEKGLLKEIEV